MTGRRADEGVDVAKLGRMHGLVMNLLGELRQLELDASAIRRLETLTQQTLVEIGSAVPDDLLTELGRILGPSVDPSADELRIVEAQLLGWMRGMAHASRLDDLQAVVDSVQDQVAQAAGPVEAIAPRLSTDGYL